MQSSSQTITTNKPLQPECPSCYPTNSVGALKRESITFHGLAYCKLTWESSVFVFDHRSLLITLGKG